MAVMAMKRVNIVGLKDERKPILEAIQRKGFLEVEDFVQEDDIFVKENAPISGSEFERRIHEAETAIEILNIYNEEKSGLLSSFKGRDVVSKEKYDNFKDHIREINDKIAAITDLYKEVTDMNGEIVRDTQTIDMLAPWEKLDVALDITGTESTAIYIGAVPGDVKKEAFEEALAEAGPVEVQIISHTKDQTCVMLICLKEQSDSVLAVLRSMGFSYPSVNASLTPSQEKERLKKEIEELQASIEEKEKEIMSFDEFRPEIKFYADYMAIREEKYAVMGRIPQSDHAFVLSGYIPDKNIPELEKLLAPYSASIDVETPSDDEDVPVKLHNNGFSSAVQGVVESYALPQKGEIDPSFIISLFYFIFFGFMLADACIGFLIAAGAAFLLIKNKNMETGLRNNTKLFCFGGISAIFFGVLFGSYFGDMVTSISGGFFGNPIVIKPLWLDMTKNPMTVLTLALIMGLIHIFTGMAVAAYQLLKKKDIVGFIFDIVAWYIILIGLVIKCLSMQMIMDILAGGSAPIFTEAVGNYGMYAAAVGAVAVLIMGGRESKNPLKRLLKGAYAIYGVTSYLSDLLSYSRLLALGLATGVISSVANMIGTMFGNGVAGIIVYVVVFIIINAINIGINTLGAYVHTNRLQYVEFFGRFYEGGGRPFQPYSIKTKYYKFKENEQ
ncbi:MAG: V-type ATP synthase subunit I [Parasporobacterium sp.]|nr:V-type ATP synthase subunit I [Parasporobacterium sp.]